MALGESWRRIVGGGGAQGRETRSWGSLRGLVGQTSLPVAIDFGAGALKVLQIGPGEPASLVGAACLATPDDLLADHGKRIAFQIDALPKLIKSSGVKGKRAVCAIPAAQAFCKHMQFQVEGSGVTVGAMVRSAVPAQLGCDPAALVFRHVEVGPIARTNKTEVICMATGRELVERLMRAIKDSKLEPVGMHIEYTAALHAFDAITRRAEDASLTSLYLDIGAGSTKVMVAHGRDLMFARTVDLGGRHLDQTVAKQMKVDLGEARAHRLAMAELGSRIADVKTPQPSAVPVPCGVPSASDGTQAAPDAAPPVVTEERRRGGLPRGLTRDLTRQPSMAFAPARADLSEPLEILTDEISMCLRYHGSVFPDRRVDRAIFIGGEARHLGLCQHIARTLKLPAQVADPMASVARSGSETTPGVDFRHTQPGWAMTLGLCLCPTDL